MLNCKYFTWRARPSVYALVHSFPSTPRAPICCIWNRTTTRLPRSKPFLRICYCLYLLPIHVGAHRVVIKHAGIRHGRLTIVLLAALVCSLHLCPSWRRSSLLSSKSSSLLSLKVMSTLAASLILMLLASVMSTCSDVQNVMVPVRATFCASSFKISLTVGISSNSIDVVWFFCYAVLARYGGQRALLQKALYHGF